MKLEMKRVCVTGLAPRASEEYVSMTGEQPTINIHVDRRSTSVRDELTSNDGKQLKVDANTQRFHIADKVAAVRAVSYFIFIYHFPTLFHSTSVHCRDLLTT
jgi:hypothetical protein